MAGMSLGQAMQERLGLAKDKRDQVRQKINDDYQIGMINALKPNGGGNQGGAAPAGLAQAKTPTFSTMISPSAGSTPGVQPAAQSNAVGQSTGWSGAPPVSLGSSTSFSDGVGQDNSAFGLPGLQTGQSVFDNPTIRQGLRRGSSYVKDKKGTGNPKKDTVPAQLAEGEAVLNAAAAEMLGRDKIAELNAEGATAMGLRGGAKMKDGVMHAAAGTERIKAKDVREALKQRPTTSQLLGEADDVMKQSDDLYKSGQTRAPTAAPVAASATTSPKLTLRGAGAALGGALNYGGYMASPEEDKVAAMPGLGPVGAMVGLAGQAMQPLRDKLYAPAYAVGDKMMNNVKSNLGMSDQAAAQAAAPKPAEIPVMELSGAPSAYEQGMRAQVEARKADNAEFSNFFNQNGITDEMRANPAQAGLRRVNVPGSTDRIYQRGNEFTGMGAPSRIAAEEARANDPAVQKAAQLKRLEELAMQGNAEAGETLRQIIKADSDLAVEGLRGKATIEAAGAKGAGKKGDGTTLTDQLKLGATLLGEGREGELLQAVSQRKQTAIAERLAAGDKEGAKAIQDAELDQDFIMDTANLMKQRELAAGNGKGKRAAYGGAAGAIGGGLLGLGAGLGLKQPKMISAGIGSLVGALGGGLYGYGTGSSGVDEFSDLNRVSRLKNNQGTLTEEGGEMMIPGDLLTPDQQVLRGLRR